DTITEYAPEQIRAFHYRHDLLHKILLDDSHAVFKNRGFQDLSCTICWHEFPELHGQRRQDVKPLLDWIQWGNVTPSYTAHFHYCQCRLKISNKRRRSAILGVIYRCRFDRYPKTWDYTIERFEKCLKGEEIVLRKDEMLEEATWNDWLVIHEGLSCDLKRYYGLIIAPLKELYPSSNPDPSPESDIVPVEDLDSPTPAYIIEEIQPPSSTSGWNTYAQDTNRDANV